MLRAGRGVALRSSCVEIWPVKLPWRVWAAKRALVHVRGCSRQRTIRPVALAGASLAGSLAQLRICPRVVARTHSGTASAPAGTGMPFDPHCESAGASQKCQRVAPRLARQAGTATSLHASDGRHRVQTRVEASEVASTRPQEDPLGRSGCAAHRLAGRGSEEEPASASGRVQRSAP